jgi:peptide methionine sulfoxide reductase msrA/msrB
MKKILLLIILVTASIWGVRWYLGRTSPSVRDASTSKSDEDVAYFAGGCFWCVESDFEKLDGVNEAISGYMGGALENPSYNDVSAGLSGHREVVKVIYDPNKITYRSLVFDLLKHSDPTDPDGSFFDRGHQYTSAVLYGSDIEKEIAEQLILELEEADIYEKPIVTSLEPASTFWIAENYHQDFYKKNAFRYNHYRKGSGRDDFIESVWGDGAHDNLLYAEKNMNNSWKNFQKPSNNELKETLTPLQYSVTQEEGTERPFQNEYWDNHDDGIYVDVVSGEPLFSSTEKFDSGTGWPSFLKPIDYSFVTEKQDYKLIFPRTEIRSVIAHSHLGHIILDGPIENNKIRYCMNSASLQFIPVEQMAQEGYQDFLYLFASRAN